MNVENICMIKYSYKFSLNNPIIRNSISSNIVSTRILLQKIKICKKVNKKISNKYDILEYTITVFNKSEEDVLNLYFEDRLPEHSIFLQNSVKINDVKKNNLNPNIGFCIGDLKYNETKTITFEVVIVKIPFNNEIANKSQISYDYLLNIEEKPLKLCNESNCCISKFQNKTFQNKIINNVIKTKCNVCYVKDIKCNCRVLNTNLIESYDRNLSKILVFIKIEYNIIYCINKKMCFENINFGEVESFNISSGVNYLKNSDVKVKILSNLYRKKNKNNILSNLVLEISI